MFEARGAWLDEAQAVVDDAISDEDLRAFKAQAAVRLEEMREQVEELKSALRVDVTYSDLPLFDIPVAETNGKVHGLPLLDSRWSFTEQCRALIAAKTYSAM